MIRVIIFILLQICFIDGLQSQVRFDSTYTSYFRRCGSGSGWNAGDATISLALPDQIRTDLFAAHIKYHVCMMSETV